MDRDNYTGLYSAYLQMYNEQNNYKDEVNKSATKELTKSGWKGENDDPVTTKLKTAHGSKSNKYANQVGGGSTRVSYKKRGAGDNRSRSGLGNNSALKDS